MKWVVVFVYLTAILTVHLRGRVRFSLSRQLLDHSSIVAPMNLFMYLLSGVPHTPYLPIKSFPAAQKNDDAGFNSFFKNGWKRFYLKWYDARHPSAELYCPKTVALLRTIPSVKAAMFAELGPAGKLNEHRDPFAGSLRYHLGLVTPNDDRCFIEVDGQRYSWRDGQAIVFDECASNRIILFCDIERPMRYRWAQAINRWLGRTLMTAASSPNETGDKTGGINKAFRYVWLAGQYRRKLKAWSRPLYYTIKGGLILAVGVIIILI